MKKTLIGLTLAALAALPLTTASPAAAAKENQPCVRISAPGSHSMKVGESREIHIRLSKRCRNALVSIDGMEPTRPGVRHLSYSHAHYMAGVKTVRVRVVPAKGEGRPVSRVFTYRVSE